jgi:hypothetical protein
LKQLDFLEFDGADVKLKADYSEESYPFKPTVIYTSDQINPNAQFLGSNPQTKLAELVKAELEKAGEPIALNQLLQALRATYVVNRTSYKGKWSEFLNNLDFATVQDSKVSLSAVKDEKEE